MKKLSLIVCFLVGAAAVAQKDETPIKYAETITAKELSKHLHIVASDSFEGRETGELGQKKAAEYIAAEFKKYGIEPLNGSYFQKFDLLKKQPGGAEIQFNSEEINFLDDYYFFGGFDHVNIQTEEALFLGYGIDTKNYSDYKGVEVQDKVIFILSGEPINKKGKSYITGKKEPSVWATSWRKKLSTAQEKGAKAVFIISTDFVENRNLLNHAINSSSMELLREEEATEENGRVPSFYISEKAAEKALQKQPAELRALINKKGEPYKEKIATKISIKLKRKEQKISSENVLGYIEGTDKKEEVLILTAHYDHIGKEGETVYNGADDDGSGTVTLLEIAQAFSQAKKDGNGPRRSVLIMPVAGEERGLLGSQYYTENPIFPLENTIADLNIDMIGRVDSIHKKDSNYVYLIGSDRLSWGLHNTSEEANKEYSQLTLDYTFNDPADPNMFYYRSDHYNFAKNNVPVIFYFCGVHEDYHEPTDTVDKIMFGKMEKIARLVFYTAWKLANAEERVEVDTQE